MFPGLPDSPWGRVSAFSQGPVSGRYGHSPCFAPLAGGIPGVSFHGPAPPWSPEGLTERWKLNDCGWLKSFQVLPGACSSFRNPLSRGPGCDVCPPLLSLLYRISPFPPLFSYPLPTIVRRPGSVGVAALAASRRPGTSGIICLTYPLKKCKGLASLGFRPGRPLSGGAAGISPPRSPGNEGVYKVGPHYGIGR